jgi:hypothetical protein
MATPSTLIDADSLKYKWIDLGFSSKPSPPASDLPDNEN